MRRIAPMLLGLCASVVICAGAASAEPQKLRFLYNASAAFAAAYVAADQGFLAKHALDIDFTMGQSGAVMPPALVAGSTDIAAPTAAVIVQAADQGIDLVVIANTSVYPTPTGQDGVVARNGTDIHGPKDLIGHKVGLPSLGGIFEVLMRKWVKANGGDDRQVQWVEVQLRQMPDALKSGLVDAVVPVEPFYTRVMETGAGYFAGDFEKVVPDGTIPVAYATTRAWAAAHADAIKAFRAALVDAIAFINEPAHLPEVRASIAKYTKLPPQAAAGLVVPANLEVAAKPSGFQFWIDAMHEQGLIARGLDPASLIAP